MASMKAFLKVQWMANPLHASMADRMFDKLECWWLQTSHQNQINSSFHQLSIVLLSSSSCYPFLHAVPFSNVVMYILVQLSYLCWVAVPFQFCQKPNSSKSMSWSFWETCNRRTKNYIIFTCYLNNFEGVMYFQNCTMIHKLTHISMSSSS